MSVACDCSSLAAEIHFTLFQSSESVSGTEDCTGLKKINTATARTNEQQKSMGRAGMITSCRALLRGRHIKWQSARAQVNVVSHGKVTSIRLRLLNYRPHAFSNNINSAFLIMLDCMQCFGGILYRWPVVRPLWRVNSESSNIAIAWQSARSCVRLLSRS